MGPTPKIWRDSQCTNLQNLDASNNLESCKRECLVAQGCNAINYGNTGGCALRKCPIPVPVPSNMHSGFNGYYLSGWVGPTPKIWRDSQCTNLKNLDASNNLEDCKRECLVAHGCNAINYANTGGCALRKCPIPVPAPPNIYPEFNGYYFNGNTEGQLRLLFYILYVCKTSIRIAVV